MPSHSEKVHEALEAWIAGLAPGSPHPSPSDVDAVAEIGVRDAVLSPTGESWRRTIEFIDKQVRFGVTPSEVAHHIPTELTSPAGGEVVTDPPAPPRPPLPTEPTATGDAPDLLAQRVDALTSLRMQLVAEDEQIGRRLPEGYLRLVAHSPATTAEEIRARGFPPVVTEFSERIAAALAPLPPVASVAGAAPASSPTPPPAIATTTTADVRDTVVAAPSPLTGSHPPSDTAARSSATVEDLSHLTFAAYLMDTSAAPEIRPLRIDRMANGAYAISWQPGEGAFVDRLVRGDQIAPYNPDQAHVVAVTTENRAIDAEAFSHAVRHYQVWRHSGSSTRAASFEQPQLVAAGLAIAPPHDIEIAEDAGTVVIGRWEVLDGTDRVQVYRVPRMQAVIAGVGNPQFRVFADRLLKGGISDHEVAPGETYVYHVISEATVGDVIHTSSPVMREVSVSQVHRQVRDLACELYETNRGAVFDLTWTDLAGSTVLIYRKPDSGPNAGYDTEPIAVSALSQQAGLSDDAKLLHPIERDGGKASMHAVPWPEEWVRAYFTPVVVVGDRAFIGNTVLQVRQPPVTDIKIIERVDQKLVTFTFPKGAQDVHLFVSQRGVPADAVVSASPTASISRSQYDLDGSVRLTPLQVPGLSTIHVVARSNQGTATVASVPTSIDYTPVMTVRYQVKLAIGLTTAARRPTLTIEADRDLTLPEGMGFVLGFRSDRLPLSSSDATDQVAVVRDIEGETLVARRFLMRELKTTGLREPGWKADPASWAEIAKQAKSGGYLRLFLNDERYQDLVAVIDPDIRSLKIGGLF